MSKRVAEISLPESVQQARGIYSPRAFLSSRAPLLISPYKSPTRSSADEFSHILFHLIIFLRNLRMPRWDDFTSCALGYRDVYNGQGMFTERKINAKKVVWEQKVERFSSLRVRKCGKSSRCWPKSFLISCTADTGTVLRESMCGSVWTRARTTWKEKWRLTSSRATYVQLFMLVDKPISPTLALSVTLIYMYLLLAWENS